MNKSLVTFRAFSRIASYFSTIFLLAVSLNAATFTVTKNADTNDGACDFDCSLREAIEAANNAPSDDVIEFHPVIFAYGQTIELSLSQSLRIVNNGTLTINGPANGLSIVGRNSRVFLFRQQANVTLRRMSIIGGNGSGDGAAGGGCILTNNSVSVLEDVIITGCKTSVIDPVTFIGGGAIHNFGGTMTISNSRIDYNRAYRQGAQTADGGGIHNSGTLIIRNSSILFNSTEGYGGGINNTGNLVITNSTIDGNAAAFTSGAYGGGIANAGVTDATHITVSTNGASNGGHGIYNLAGGTFNSKNSIYADNIWNTPQEDFSGTMTSGGYNLIENTTGTTITNDTTGNILGQDPMLQILQGNGNGPYARKPAANSPVIDKGKSFGISADQRGLNRPLDLGNLQNAPGGDGADIGAVELQINDFPRGTTFDFDGDRKTDLGIIRSGASWDWWINQSSTGQSSAARFGMSGDQPVPADYTGDGRADIAVFRPSDNNWYILRSENSTYYAFPFGIAGDIPVVGDFDGDRKADPTVFRPENGYWYIKRSSNGNVSTQEFGVAGDQPVAADYDGDGKDDIAIFRPSTGAWWIFRSGGRIIAVQFGQTGDKTVQGDYTGDGKADIAFWRPSNGFWYILRSEDNSYYGFPFGLENDFPVPGDYDGDGKADPSVYRPSNNGWYLNQSTAGTASLQYGISGDYPIPNAYVR